MAFQPNAFQNDAFQIVKVPDWFVALSEPVRFRTYFPARERFPAFLGDYTRSFYVGIADPHFVGWYKQLSLPVFPKPAFDHGSRLPWFFAIYNIVDFSLRATEAPDTIHLAINVNLPKRLARVAITERKVYAGGMAVTELPVYSARVTITSIPRYTARVTITKIKRTRGYS